MNFASKKLNGFYKDPDDLTVREQRLIAENKRLTKRNKRLSGAMVYLVGHIEKRLPFFNSKLKKSEKSTPSLPLTDPTAAPKKASPVQATAPKPARKKIIGQAWTPENLNSASTPSPKQPRRKDPLSMQQIFADKKRERENLAQADTDISEVVFVDRPSEKPIEKRTDKKPLYDRAQAAKETIIPQTPKEPEILADSVDDDQPSQIEETPVETVVVTTDETEATLTPELAPEEMNILAAPTRDKKQDVFQPQPSELITDRQDKKTSARDASLAYMAVAVAAKPVPTTEILTDDDTNEMNEHDIIADQVARQNDVMRAAMLRRVNRLRW